jgi:hypothetical protein
MMTNDNSKPAIVVYIDQNFTKAAVLAEVLNGIEEEGIFYNVEKHSVSDARDLAKAASNTTTLEVGIGLDSNGYLVLHYKKMDTPLFEIQYNIETDNVRKIGTNAARLVKGVPFV